MLFAKPSKSIGVDIGAHSVKAIQMSKVGGRLRIDQVGYGTIDRNQVNIDPVIAHAEALREALRAMPVAQGLLVGSLPGQTAVIRYPRLPNIPYDQIEQSIESEAAQSIPYDLAEVFLDWALLDTVTEGNESQYKVLLVAARHEVIESRAQIAAAGEVQFAILDVDTLALADAAESCDFLRVGETVALVDLGLSSTNIHFVKDGVSNFVRDVSWGTREMIQAIAKGLRCDYDEAEKTLRDAAMGVSGEPSVPEPATAAAQEASEETAPGGGASLLDPLEEELAGGDQPPIGGGPAAGPAAGGEKSIPEMLSLPLSRLVAETRRSFDYYEQQLYERPVERIILSGGIAPLPLLREALAQELGIENVEVADPTDSALLLGNDRSLDLLRDCPAQYMVAVGLAARGTLEI